MRRNLKLLQRLGISILGVLTISAFLLGQSSLGQSSLGQSSRKSEANASVTDWSDHHVIFSRPATAEQARRVQQDPRYRQQIARQSRTTVPAVEIPGALAPELQLVPDASFPSRNQNLNHDWAQDIGAGASVGAGNYPAKFSFDITTANCGDAPQPDFVVYTTGEFGPTQAGIVAYDNLYSGCGGTVPSVYWAYTTGAKILTSPVFSLDGTQVAYVQSNSTFHGIVVLLKWAPSATETVASPGSLTRVSRASYPTCVAPCMTTATLGGTELNNDTNSSIFYDYSHDTAYVGDDAGWLHKFTPFFNGVLAEIKTGGWPVQLNPASPTALTSPVYDGGSGNVFVEDKGGYLYWVAPDGIVTQSGLLDHSTAEHGGPGLVQGPIVDSSAGLVYVFATSDGSGTGCPVDINNADCTVVYLTNTSFSAGDIPPKAIVGTSTMAGTTPTPLYIGAFDSTYENSSNATGNLYVCGNTGGDPVLYQVAITAGNFSSVAAGPVLSTSFSATPCSPVTDVFNPNASGGATEWIFASVQNGGASTPCASGGCVFNFQDTAWKPSTAYTVGQEVLDDHFQIQVVFKAGTSGSSAPTWSTTVDGLTPDGTTSTLIWVDQGVQSAFTPGTWAAGFAFSVGTLILDSNGNIERCIASFGPSGSSVPIWNTTPGLVTSDFDVVWENLGVPATAALAAAGGTSGIIIDNIVGSGTEVGASDIYFSTLNGGCGTSSTDGCAVQASQAALQ